MCAPVGLPVLLEHPSYPKVHSALLVSAVLMSEWPVWLDHPLECRDEPRLAGSVFRFSPREA